MKSIKYIALTVLAGVSLASCNNFFGVKSPSVVDGDFVIGSIETGKSIMLGAYNTYINHTNTGMMCNLDNIGSDMERCSAPIAAADLCGAANMWGGLTQWEVENVAVTGKNLNPWGDMYNIISKCNQVIYLVQGKENFTELEASAPNEWTDLLGQAYCLRATAYYDLTRWYGDVIYIDEAGKDITTFNSRYATIDGELENVRRVVDKKYMFSMGENNHFADQMTRNYAEGLIGRLCFMQAGYQTRRTDGDYANGFYVDGKGNAISFVDEWKDADRQASYARPSNYKDYYAIALPYLKDAVENTAGAKLVTVDPRSDNKGRTYGNPFQYVFEQFNDLIISEESIYEVAMKPVGGGSRVPYNYGRGAGNNNPGFPPKANAQTCSYPENFFGLFDPADMRRDVSFSITGSNGWGVETLYSYKVGNRLDVGIGMNKFDPNRTEVDRYEAKQLTSGINFPVMRQSDIILMYAEALAVTGSDAAAKAELKKVHDRAFNSSTAAVKDAKLNELIASCGGSIYDAIIKERSLEFVGEGLRRWDLIRTGTFPKVSVEFRQKLTNTINQMKTQGYAKFDNGNEFPAYVWTKLVDANTEYGYRLTMQCPAGKEDDPVLYPSWRGQHDDWLACAEKYYGDKAMAASKITVDKTNLAIKGLFKHIEPGSAEAQALEADGYKMVEYGIQMLANPSREAEWSTNFQAGYTDAMYAAKKAPIYLVFIKSDILTTVGHTNGYGFKSE